jgi:glycine/D-amino acid oxidase-like deaminating enzyme
MMRVAIVGGGAAGVLSAVHLRRAVPDAQITNCPSRYRFAARPSAQWINSFNSAELP